MKKKNESMNNWKEIVGSPICWVPVSLLVLFISAYIFDPLIYFTLFFCLLHSPRHFSHELKLIASHKPWVVLAVVLGIMAVTIALGFMMGETLSLKISYSNDLLAIVFIGIACLTYPHVLLIEYGKIKTS